MIGIRPAIAQIYQQVNEAPPKFPAVISTLISEYAEDDFSLAQEPLRREKRGDFIDIKGSRNIFAAIKLALESPLCDNAIKVKIFENTRGEYAYSMILDSVFRSIREGGGRIILDNCHFENVQLTSMDLSGASAVSTKFTGVTMQLMNLTQIDLSGALLVDTVIKNTELSEASLYKALLKNCTISVSDLTSVNLRKAGFEKVTFQSAIMNRCDIDDPRFWKAIEQSKVSMFDARMSAARNRSMNYEESRLVDYANKKNTNSIFKFSGSFSSESPPFRGRRIALGGTAPASV